MACQFKSVWSLEARNPPTLCHDEPAKATRALAKLRSAGSAADWPHPPEAQIPFRALKHSKSRGTSLCLAQGSACTWQASGSPFSETRLTDSGPTARKCAPFEGAVGIAVPAFRVPRSGPAAFEAGTEHLVPAALPALSAPASPGAGWPGTALGVLWSVRDR